MKIGIDISQIVYQTGVSRYTNQLVKHLLKLKTNHRFYLFGGSLRQQSILSSYVSSLKPVNSRSLHWSLTWLSPKLADLFFNQLNLLSVDRWLTDLDVFHASNWAIPKTKAKLVTTIHDLTFIKFPQTHTKKSQKVHSRHLKRAQKMADIVITDSISTQKDLIDYGFNQKKIKVIYPAPAKIFKPLKNTSQINQIRNKYDLQTSYILSVGTQEPRKNIDRLIKAYDQLSHPRPILAIAGKFGWGETTRPVSGVKLLGFVPDQDLVGLYSSAKAFIYPSLYEGFGFPILEAMACGCPVITSDLSSLPELGGQAALYIKNPRQLNQITQSLKTILKLSPVKRKQMIKQGLKQAKQFSWIKTAQKTLKVYQSLKK